MTKCKCKCKCATHKPLSFQLTSESAWVLWSCHGMNVSTVDISNIWTCHCTVCYDSQTVFWRFYADREVLSTTCWVSRGCILPGQKRSPWEGRLCESLFFYVSCFISPSISLWLRETHMLSCHPTHVLSHMSYHSKTLTLFVSLQPCPCSGCMWRFWKGKIIEPAG